MYRKFKRLMAWSLVVCIMLTQMILSKPAFALTTHTTSFPSTRLAGADRYQTAVEISKAEWITSDYAVLTYGEDFPDALCAAPLAGKYDAPILLTRKDSIPFEVLNELKRLGVKYLFIVGGEGVVSRAVADTLSSTGMQVERLAGASRYETSLAVAYKIGTTNEVVLVNGDLYADALSISSIAAKKGMPILLTGANTVDAATKAYIGTKKAYIVGGEGAVGSSVFYSLTGAVRIGGYDRYATNLAILQHFAADIDWENVFLATGEGFADALSGSALAAANDGAIVLTGSSLPAASSSFLAGKITSSTNVIAFGGHSIVSDAVVASVKAPIPSTPAVESVTAVNLKQILVKFNKEVDKTCAENAGKYRFNGEQLVTGVDHAKLQSDKRSVLITLGGAGTNAAAANKKLSNNTSYDFKVDPILDTAGQYTAAYVTTIIYADSKIPSVSSVEVIGSKILKVIFNEPVYNATFGGGESYSIPALRFSIDEGVYPVVSADFKAEINAVEIVLYTALSAGSHTLKVKPDPSTNAIVDYAGYRPLEQSMAFNVYIDTTAPMFTIKEATDTSVRIVFSKPMNVSKLVGNTNIRFRHSYDQTLTGSVNEVTGADVTAIANTDDKEFLINFGPNKVLPVGPNYLYFGYPDSSGTKVEDKFGNIMAAGYVTMTIYQDVTAPVITSVIYVDKNNVEVTYSEDVVGGNIPSNYTIKNKDQETITVTNAYNVAGTDTYRLTTGSQMNGGTYTISVANVKDSSLKSNVMTAVTLSFTASDTVAPSIRRAIVYENGKKIRVYFNEDMSDEGLTDKGNYSWQADAGVVTALSGGDTVIRVDYKTVEIVLANAVPALNAGAVDQDKVHVSGSLKDLAGNRLSYGISVWKGLELDNSALTVSYESGDSKVAHALDKRTIEFKVDRLMQSVTPALITLTGAGANTVTAASIVNDTLTNKATVKITLQNDLDTSLGTAFNVNFLPGAFTTLLGALSITQNAVFNNTQVKDYVAPLPLKAGDAKTKDVDGDRQIDQIEVTYSEPIQTTSIQVTDYTVEGYVVNDISVNGNKVIVKITESGVIDESSTPKLTQVGEVADDSNQHNILGAQSAITPVDNVSSNALFASSQTKKGGAAVTLNASPILAETVWFAPAGSTVFTAGPTMTTLAGNGVVNTINAPANEGVYKLFVVDNATGRVSVASTATLTVDNTAPAAVLTSATADNKINIAEKAAGFNVIAQSSDPAGKIYVVPSGAAYANEAALIAAAITSGTVVAANTDVTMAVAPAEALLTNGSTWSIYAVDAVGNVSVGAAGFTVDITAPAATRTSATVDNIISAAEKAAGFNVIAQSSEAAGKIYVVPAGAVYANEAALDAADIVSGNVVAAGTDVTMAVAAGEPALTNGSTWSIYAVDASGNVSAAAAGFTVNIASPAATRISATADYIINAAEKAAGFNVVAQSSAATGKLYIVPAGVYANEAALDAVDIASGNVAAANTDVTMAVAAGAAALTDGSTWSIYAVDAVGNISAGTAGFTVDITAPTVVNASTKMINDTTFQIKFSEAVNIAAGNLTDFKYDAAGGPPATAGNITGIAGAGTDTITVTVTAMVGYGAATVGTVDVAAAVTDLAGNPIVAVDNQPIAIQ